MFKPSADHYATLQVSPEAEPEVIEGAYRKLAQKYHPDKNRSREALQRMQAINAAYEVLRDPVQRAAYDRSHGSRSSTQGGVNAKATTPLQSKLSFEDMSSGLEWFARVLDKITRAVARIERATRRARRR
ncbi:MAG: J domain-containing protein [Anaerolineales bacterium]